MKKLAGIFVDVMELRIAVGMIGAFTGLSVGVQTVASFSQQLRYQLVTHEVTVGFQMGRQHSYTLGGPAQRRFGVS